MTMWPRSRRRDLSQIVSASGPSRSGTTLRSVKVPWLASALHKLNLDMTIAGARRPDVRYACCRPLPRVVGSTQRLCRRNHHRQLKKRHYFAKLHDPGADRRIKMDVRASDLPRWSQPVAATLYLRGKRW